MEGMRLVPRLVTSYEINENIDQGVPYSCCEVIKKKKNSEGKQRRGGSGGEGKWGGELGAMEGGATAVMMHCMRE